MKDRQVIRAVRSALMIVIVLTALLVSSCGGPLGTEAFSLSELVDGPDGESLAVSPNGGTLAAGVSLDLETRGGIPPYEYEVIEGSGTLVENRFTAPGTSGQEVVRVTDRVGSIVDVRFTVDASGNPLAIYPQSPSVSVGESVTFVPLGGAAPYTFEFTDDDALPYSVIATPPSGGMINATTGLYSSGFIGGVTDYVVLTDNLGAQTVAAITVPPPALLLNVDYVFDTAPGGGTVTPGTSMSGLSFQLRNAGTDDGIAPLTWEVYRSTSASVADIELPALATSPGSEPGGLNSGDNTGPVNIAGTWPAAGPSWPYRIIIRAGSKDDSSDALYISPPYYADVPDPDYVVSDTLFAGFAGLVGEPIDGSFTIKNVGGAPGPSFGWELYVSNDSDLDAGDGPPVLSEAGLSPLGSGSSTTDSMIRAAWPYAGSNVHLFIKITPDGADAPNDGNNVMRAGPFDIRNPPDYSVSILDAQSLGIPGTTLDQFGPFSFQITNTGDIGTEPVSWTVYLSDDQILDDTDAPVTPQTSDTIGAFAPGNAPDGPFSIGGESWPGGLDGSYYLIFEIDADDDENSGNDTVVHGPILIPDVYGVTPYLYVEGTEDNSDFGPLDITPPSPDSPLANVSDLDSVLPAPDFTIELGDVILISGLEQDNPGQPEDDGLGGYDTYRVTIGGNAPLPAVTALSVYAVWGSAMDAIDLFIWDEYGNQWSSIDTSSGREPETGSLVATSVIAGETIYVGVNYYGELNAPYALVIRAE